MQTYRYQVKPKRQLPSSAKEILAATTAAFANIAVGQPFDIVKVRIQSSTQHIKAREVVGRIIKNEGMAAFYKGSTSPLYGSIMLTSI